MKNVKSLVFAALATAVLVVACSDRPDSASPTGPRSVRGHKIAYELGGCTTIGALNTLASSIFGPPNVNSVLGKLDNLKKKVEAGDVTGAGAQALNIVGFVRDKAAQLIGTEEQVEDFISGVLCYGGMSPDTFLILPTDDPQTKVSDDGESGVSLLGGTVDVPTLLTITTLEDPPLDTKLDQYPGWISIVVSSHLTKPAVVAVCPPASVPSDVRARLRLGHQTGAGFEVTPSADASFLRCETSVAQSRMPGWLRTVANIVLPKKLYAAPFELSGIGGSATEFSPFGAVDTELSFAGGVGGSATEFIRSGDPNLPRRLNKKPGTAKIVVGGVCTEVSVLVGTGLEPECRPVVTAVTHNGTVFANVPVSWEVLSGGGTIAPDNLSNHQCGAFAATALTATNSLGKAGICWTLGANSGPNTAKATPSAGGDAPAGVTFNPPSFEVTATGTKITPTVSATGGTFPFDNAPHAGSGTCSDGLTPALTYSNGSAPVNVGSYTLTVTCGGGPVYNEVTANAPISITAVAPVVTVTCPVSVVYTGGARTPCSANAAAPGLNTSVSVSYTNNINVGTANASASYAAGGNYSLGTGANTFAITPAGTTTSVSCPASVPYTGTARTPCSASVSGPGLSASLTVSYANNVNAGNATASASFTAAGNYQGSNNATNFTIAKLDATATAGSATINFGAAVPSMPCNVTGLLATESGAVTCTTGVPAITVAGTYTTVPVVSPANPTNYAVAKVNGTLTVRGYVQSGCFSSPIYSVMPETKSAQKKGSNLPVKCTLFTAQGAPVTNATGNLLVVDRGPTGTSPPVTVFNGTNVFKFSTGGNYAVGLDTSAPAYVVGHAFYVTATWNDGSQTTGWFLLK